MEIITIYDYLLLPFYIIICYYFVVLASNKYKGTELKKYFIIAFSLRVFGGIFYPMLISYYYGTGDMLSYYQGGEIIADMIKNDFSAIQHLFTGGEELYRISELAGYGDRLSLSMGNNANVFVMKVAGIISFISFGKFMVISLFFSALSFIGIWKIYSFLDQVSGRKHSRILAWLVLYTPSIWFFGSGIQKEPLCLLAMGISLHYFYRNIILKKYNIIEILLMILAMMVLLLVKNYIAIILAFGLAVVIFYSLIVLTRNILIRGAIITVLFFLLLLGLTLLDVPSIIQQSVEVSVEQIQESKRIYEEIGSLDERSRSGFTIADINPSLGSLFMHSWEVIATCLFRPFPWESRKIIILFASLEAFLTLLATLYVLMRSKVYGFFTSIFSSPILLFCFTVSMLFATLIGFTTFNFGTVVRYKIIFLPFYFYFLIAVSSRYKSRQPAKIVNAVPAEHPAPVAYQSNDDAS